MKKKISTSLILLVKISIKKLEQKKKKKISLQRKTTQKIFDVLRASSEEMLKDLLKKDDYHPQKGCENRKEYQRMGKCE